LKDSGFDELAFIGRFRNSTNPYEIANDIKQTLGLTENWASNFNTWQEALSHLSEVIEDNGIINVFNGVVENNPHRPIDVEECRGFVLVDDYAPFMFVNNADSKSAQMFTVAHELAHLWTGKSAGFDFRKLQAADDPNEQLCDKVAAEFLVPESIFRIVWSVNRDIKRTAKHFKVSEIVIARRALDLNEITRQQFFNFYEVYKSREFSKKSKSTGGDFYATTRKRISITFASHVENAVRSGQLLYRDAYKLTSMKGDTFNRFFTELV
jgi:Zn-dependent peptidase ImmA (M78 family)